MLDLICGLERIIIEIMLPRMPNTPMMLIPKPFVAKRKKFTSSDSFCMHDRKSDEFGLASEIGRIVCNVIVLFIVLSIVFTVFMRVLVITITLHYETLPVHL